MDVEEYNPADDQPSPVIKGAEITGPFEPTDTQMEENIIDKAIHDIDTVDCDNALAVSEYVQDIYSYYGQIEEHSCVPPDYMSKQSDIDKKMRGKLIDWLIRVHHNDKLSPETLHLTVNIIDRFLARQLILKKNLKLVGVTAMLLASKYEEVSKPRVGKLIDSLHLDYSRREILETEMLIIETLGFNLSFPTPYVFIRRILKAANSDKKLEKLSCFIVEQSLVEYTMLKFRPSLLAAAAVYTALSALRGRNQWNEVIEFHSRYTEEQLLECARMMMDKFLKSEGCSKFKFDLDQRWNQELR